MSRSRQHSKEATAAELTTRLETTHVTIPTANSKTPHDALKRTTAEVVSPSLPTSNDGRLRTCKIGDMNLNYDWLPLIGELRSIGMEFHAGLSDVAVAGIEGTYGFRFPPDLRAFLQTAMPFVRQVLPSGYVVSQRSYFPDWRSDSEGVLRDWLDIPRQGVFFDIECNGFWLPEWGERPESTEDALQIAGKLLDNAPKLIPIFQHRMIPDDPHLEGNPVFSVHQTDIIYYGHDLEDYLRHEFGLSGRKPWNCGRSAFGISNAFRKRVGGMGLVPAFLIIGEAFCLKRIIAETCRCVACKFSRFSQTAENSANFASGFAKDAPPSVG